MRRTRPIAGTRLNWLEALATTLALTGLVAGCAHSAEPPRPVPGSIRPLSAAVPAIPERMPPVCDHLPAGPDAAPAGAVVVDPAVRDELARLTEVSPAGSVFWLRPGLHSLAPEKFAQVKPRDGNTYLGAPGAILDGQRINRYAFTGQATDVTIKHLTVRGFAPPLNEGVVNHDSGDGWIIESSTIEDNKGAGLMAGSGQVVRGSCLRNNGQYGMNAYQRGNGISGLVVENNEIVGNNRDDWERKQPGCGCSGGVKFWANNGVDVRSNWIHDNRGVGLWADTNNNDFVIEGNLIENNDSEGIFYETSYNLVLRANLIRNNAAVKGKIFADRGANFPVAAIYLSEAGGEPRIPARTDKIDIYRNRLENNWSGITAWENADRFCNSAANTSTRSCTKLVSEVSQCAQPAIGDDPLREDCRWKTQRVDVHENVFVFSPSAVSCAAGSMIGRMAVLSNFGTFPSWSPYRGDSVAQAVTFNQENVWRANKYIGPWMFTTVNQKQTIDENTWKQAPYSQDADSTFSPASRDGACP